MCETMPLPPLSLTFKYTLVRVIMRIIYTRLIILYRVKLKYAIFLNIIYYIGEVIYIVIL